VAFRAAGLKEIRIYFEKEGLAEPHRGEFFAYFKLGFLVLLHREENKITLFHIHCQLFQLFSSVVLQCKNRSSGRILLISFPVFRVYPGYQYPGYHKHLYALSRTFRIPLEFRCSFEL